MPDYTETEVKLYVPHLEVVQARLEMLGATLTAPRVYEQNVRYENAAHTLTSDGIVLRLRQDTRARLTYKEGGSAQDGIVSRTEIEVEVSDFAAMEAILVKLGYATAMRYEKYRTTFALNGVEIVLDEMPYGNFVEIEGESGAIAAAIDRLELQDAPRSSASYVTLFEKVKAQLGLTFNDLTFGNFKGLTVPESMFRD